MKKSLLALAAMTAFAGAAQAQSSVTVYGLIDANFSGTHTTLNNSNGGATYQNGQKQTTTAGFGNSGDSGSRLGFKGSEDLGGGTQAMFTYEVYMYPQDQSLSGDSKAGSTTAGYGLYNRQSFVGLHKNGVGAATLGLQYTPIFNAQAVTDPGADNNIVGNVVFSTGPGTDTNGADTVSAFTQRTANTLFLKSDSFAGFTGSAMYTQNNSNTTQTGTAAAPVGGNTNASGWGLGADYTWHKLYVTGAYQALKQLTTASNIGTPAYGSTSTPWTSPQPGAAVGNAGAAASAVGINVQDNQGYIGATYDFGILKAYAQYVTRKATSTQSPNYYVKRSAEQIGVRSFITPAVEAWASAGLGRYQAFGASQPTANFNAWQLGSNYYLSKRTNLYAIYGQQLFSTAATATATASASVQGYAVGVRHTF